MTHNHCATALCSSDALTGYRHCAIHLTADEVFTFTESAGARIQAYHEAHTTGTKTVDVTEAYDLARRGYEVLARIGEGGAYRFVMAPMWAEVV